MNHVAVPFLCFLRSIWQRHRTLVQSPKKEKQQEGWLVGSFESRFQRAWVFNLVYSWANKHCHKMSSDKCVSGQDFESCCVSHCKQSMKNSFWTVLSGEKKLQAWQMGECSVGLLEADIDIIYDPVWTGPWHWPIRLSFLRRCRNLTGRAVKTGIWRCSGQVSSRERRVNCNSSRVLQGASPETAPNPW